MDAVLFEVTKGVLGNAAKLKNKAIVHQKAEVNFISTAYFQKLTNLGICWRLFNKQEDEKEKDIKKMEEAALMEARLNSL